MQNTDAKMEAEVNLEAFNNILNKMNILLRLMFLKRCLHKNQQNVLLHRHQRRREAAVN